MQALKDRVVEVETELRALQEENDKLRRAQEKAEATKVSLARKEQQVSSLKVQLDNLRQEMHESTTGHLAQQEKLEHHNQ